MIDGRKTPGTPFAGTINGKLAEIERPNRQQTTIAKIIHLVEEESSVAALRRCLCTHYTPSVMVAALLVMLCRLLLDAMAHMVLSRLVLSARLPARARHFDTRLGRLRLAALARRGVLIKGGVVLEAVANRALAVDKRDDHRGKPRVTKS
jgi:Cd2+/Zn2+-exporting ATPase